MNFNTLFGEWRAAHPSATGLSLTTTAQKLAFPEGTCGVSLRPHTFSTAVVARVAFLPYLSVLVSSNAMAAVTDASVNAQDGVAATVVSLGALPTLANGGSILVGARRPFGGLYVDMTASVNAQASVLSAHYWNGSAWTTLSPTDGTASAGATFAQDGDITWTAPSAWSRVTLAELAAAGHIPVAALGSVPAGIVRSESIFWARLSVSAALSATVNAAAILALPAASTYAEIIAGDKLDVLTPKRLGGSSGLLALTDAGTAKLVVNVASGNGFPL